MTNQDSGFQKWSKPDRKFIFSITGKDPGGATTAEVTVEKKHTAFYIVEFSKLCFEIINAAACTHGVNF